MAPMAGMKYRMVCTVMIIITVTHMHALDIYDTSFQSEFQDAVINCAEDNCTIICDEQLGCHSANITCPRNHYCDITCSAQNACLYVCIMSSNA